jgi:hypothetical protein
MLTLRSESVRQHTECRLNERSMFWLMMLQSAMVRSICYEVVSTVLLVNTISSTGAWCRYCEHTSDTRGITADRTANCVTKLPNMYSELICLFPAREFVCFLYVGYQMKPVWRGATMSVSSHILIPKRSVDIDKNWCSEASVQIVSAVTDWLRIRRHKSWRNWCHSAVPATRNANPTVLPTLSALHAVTELPSLYSLHNEMGEACSAYVVGDRCKGFGGETWAKETNWETQM